MPIIPLLSITSGWTGVLGPFTLRTDGNPFALTGYTVALTARSPLGNEVTLGGTIAVLDQVATPGQVTYTPVATDFVWIPGTVFHGRQPYYIHWRVIDGAGKVVTFPNGEADEISVSQV